MKKRNLMTGGAAIALAVSSAFAASNYTRIDFMDNAGSFVSVLLNDLRSITYGGGDTDSGFTTLTVTGDDTYGEPRTLDISQYPSMRITPVQADSAYAINIENAENYRVNLLDRYNNSSLIDGLGTIDPNQPIGWRGNQPDCEGNFLLEATPGYEGTYKIIGQYTGKDYALQRGFVWVTPDSLNNYWCDCFTFYMPNEPITFITEEVALNTYDGEEFVGEYRGALLPGAAKTIGITPELNAVFSLQGNGAYTFQTTDSCAYDEVNLYTYDYMSDVATYVYTAREDWDESTHYGIVAHRYGDIAILEVKNITSGRIEDTRLYIVSTDPDFTFTYVTDDYGIDHVVEATTAAGTRYFYLTQRGSNIYEASANFYYGSQIGCRDRYVEAVISVDGVNKCKVQNSYGYASLINAGSEAGTYSGIDGDIELDGFTAAWLNGVQCTYTYDSGLVTLTESGQSRIFVLDVEHHTYTEMVNDEWTGAETYTIENASGINENGEENTNNSITVTFNRNLLGNEAEGYASVVIRADGLGSSAVQDMGRYVYDASTRTVTITHILVGLPNEWGSTRCNLVLKVAADMKSLYIDDTESDRIYATTSWAACVFVGSRNTLLAPQTEPEVTGTYAGKAPLDMFGSSDDVDVTLTIDPETETAKFAIVAYNYTMIGSQTATYSYSIEDSTLTIHDVKVGKGDYTFYNTDITFTINDDGTLTGSGSYYGADFTVAMMVVNLSGAILAHPEEE